MELINQTTSKDLQAICQKGHYFGCQNNAHLPTETQKEVSFKGGKEIK